MVDFGFLKKKINKEDRLDLDINLPADGKMDFPPPPSPTEAGGPNFPEFPPILDEQKKVILPPLFGEERPGLSKLEGFENLDQDWKDFAKITAEPEAQIQKPELEVKKENAPLPQKPEIKVNTISPLFIEADSYSKFIDEIDRLRIKLHLLGGVIAKIDDLREKEDSELRRWHQNIDEIRKKLLFIDDALFESRR